LQLGDTEIEDLDVESPAMVGLKPDVIRLQVAMNDAAGMGGIESERYLIDDVEDLIRGGTRIPSQEFGEVLAIQEFHYQIGKLPVAGDGGSKVGHVDHVGVAQTPGRFGLALKAEEKLVLCGELGDDYLHRDDSRGAEVDRLEYSAHSTFAKLPLDTVLSIQYGARQRSEVHDINGS
jgi:hypothetical protein